MSPYETMYSLISSHVAHDAPLLTLARFTVNSVRFLHLMYSVELEEAISAYPVFYAARLRGMIESRSDLMREEEREALGANTDDVHEDESDGLLTDAPLTSNTDYDNLVPPRAGGDGELSEEQDRVVRLVQRHLHQNIRPGFRVFLTGAAGTGKSRVIRAVENVCHQYSEEHMGTAMRHAGVRTCATTGAAASLLNAITFHALLGFKIDAASQRQHPSAERLAAMRADWHGVRVVIIDECSMLTLPLLHYANDRLNHIFEVDPRSGVYFGNLCVLLCGDLSQLPPTGRRLYTPAADGYSLFRALFHPVFLTHSYRQQTDPAFTALLNRMREGDMNAADFRALHGRLLRYHPVEYHRRFRNSVHLYATNLLAETRNFECLSSLGVRIFAFRATDHFIDGRFLPTNYQANPNQHSPAATRMAGIRVAQSGGAIEYLVTCRRAGHAQAQLGGALASRERDGGPRGRHCVGC
jgi:hypothetical protein